MCLACSTEEATIKPAASEFLVLIELSFSCADVITYLMTFSFSIISW
jgi:hypothetical protein